MRSVFIHVIMVTTLCVRRTPQDRLTQLVPPVAQATTPGAAVEEVCAYVCSYMLLVIVVSL